MTTVFEWAIGMVSLWASLITLYQFYGPMFKRHQLQGVDVKI